MKYSLVYRCVMLLRKHGYAFREELQPEVVEMQQAIAALDNGAINFQIKTYPDGSWTAEATNVEGLNTGGRKQSEIKEVIKDAIFTYYGVPAKYSNDKLLRNTDEPVTIEQTVHVTA